MGSFWYSRAVSDLVQVGASLVYCGPLDEVGVPVAVFGTFKCQTRVGAPRAYCGASDLAGAPLAWFGTSDLMEIPLAGNERLCQVRTPLAQRGFSGLVRCNGRCWDTSYFREVPLGW